MPEERTTEAIASGWILKVFTTSNIFEDRLGEQG
jgi:hypothetical protein